MKTLFDQYQAPRSLVELKQQWVNCTKCDFAPARRQVVFGAGNEGAAVLFVGQFPGKDEDNTGVAFCGRAGIICKKAASRISEIPENDQYWTNSIHCLIPEMKARMAYVRNCTDLLDEEIRLVEPRLIVVMGNWAMKRFLGATGAPRGTIFTYRGIQGITATFPAVYYRHPKKEDRDLALEHIKEDFRKIGEIYRAKD